ncbi:MAG: methionine--tRNA ligase [Janthinobacterium lividum]
MPRKKYYITTPIYYVNDAPHIGSAYTTITADVLARFKRLDGYDVFFMTGTDEYGQKIEKSAREANMAPLDFVNKVSQHFRDLYPIIDATPDAFMRTTDPHHHKAAQHIWQCIEENGHIYESTYAGWYAIRDEAFYGEKELIDGKAPSGAAVEWVEEPSHFFRLSAWQEPLLEFYRTNPDFISPESRRNEVMRFVEGGLHDLSISRSTFNWGIPVPQASDIASTSDRNPIMYVWLEALTIYLTSLGYPDDFDEKSQRLWSESLHLMGKDILRFHAVYWPAFLMAAGLQPPKKVFAHGWWTNQGAKISKSLKNTIDPIALIEKYGSDQIRYFLCREVPFGQDGEFSEGALLQRINSDLANDFGNLSQRVLSFIQKNAEGKIPQPEEYTEKDQNILNLCQRTIDEVRKHADHQALSKMCESIWALVAEGNRYIDAQQPWSLKKTDPLRMNTVLYVLVEVLRHMGILSQAIVPKAASKLLDQLAVAQDQRNLCHLLDRKLTPGDTLPVPEGLFPRLQHD